MKKKEERVEGAAMGSEAYTRFGTYIISLLYTWSVDVGTKKT